MTSFSYQKNARGEFFPIIEFFISYKNTVTRASALVDSGASISVFRSEIGDQLGISTEHGKVTYLRSAVGRIKGYIHTLTIAVADNKFSCPIVLSRELFSPFNLIGRKGFFEHFTVIFEEKRHQLRLE